MVNGQIKRDDPRAQLIRDGYLCPVEDLDMFEPLVTELRMVFRRTAGGWTLFGASFGGRQSVGRGSP